MVEISNDELRRNFRDRNTWLRFVYLLLFAVALYLAGTLVFAMTVVQFLSRLFSGHVFLWLSSFGDNLADYQAAVSRYLTFTSDDKPFPFAPFPNRHPASSVESNCCTEGACKCNDESGKEL